MAGSAGHATFGGFPRYVLPSCLTTIYCFIHLCSIGQQVSCLGGNAELRDWEEIDLGATAATIGANLEVIRGIKLRLAGKLAASDGTKLVKMAKKTTKTFGLPIMLHIGDDLKPRWPVSPKLTQEVLPLLEQGDILTHFSQVNRANPCIKTVLYYLS